MYQELYASMNTKEKRLELAFQPFYSDIEVIITYYLYYDIVCFFYLNNVKVLLATILFLHQAESLNEHILH